MLTFPMATGNKTNSLEGQATAVWAITPNGVDLARKIAARKQGVILFVSRKMVQDHGEGVVVPGEKLFDSLSVELPKRFREFSFHLFIFSTGIAVRMVSSLLESKVKDPAVVVVDEKGLHAISLISGHLGGANELANEIASIIGAQPVITTATDLNNLPAIDVIAKEKNIYIENPDGIKHVSMGFLQQKKILVYDPLSLVKPLISGYIRNISDDSHGDPELICTWEIIKVPRETLRLRPQVLSVGVGCNRNTSAADINEFVTRVFQENSLSLHSIFTIGTTEVKQDEEGILVLADTLGRPIQFYDKPQLNSVTSIENPSKMAEKYLGVKSVCEAAAILGAKGGRLIVPKQKTKDVTVAVAILE